MRSIFNSLGSNYARGSFVLSFRRPSTNAQSLLQAELKRRYESEHIQLTYKGREAIAHILKSLNLSPGSFVAITGYTCYAVYQAVKAAGHEPFYVDIERNNLNFSAESLESAFMAEPNIKAVIIQNTLGIPCDISNIKQVCQKYKALLIEDLAQSVGVRYASGQAAGSLGDAVALSFGQDKIIDAVSGGALVMKTGNLQKTDPQPAGAFHRLKTRIYPFQTQLIRSTTSIGIGKVLLKGFRVLKLLPGPMSGKANQVHKLPKWHSQAAYEGFQELEQSILRRQNIAEIYRAVLPSEVQLQHHEGAIYLRFPILVDKPTELIEYLKKFHTYIGDRWYDAPVSPPRTLSITSYKAGQCPNAEFVAGRIVNLPTHVHINHAEARKLAERIKEWLTLQSKQ